MAKQTESWYSNPSRFWQSFKGNAPFSPLSSDVDGWTSYFEQLFAGHRVGQYMGGSLETHAQHFGNYFGAEVPQDKVDVGRSLNVDISEQEVIQACKALGSHKSPGYDGVPAEFLAGAWVKHSGEIGWTEHLLAPALTHLFNLVLHGDYPRAWGQCHLSPVPKPKGDPTVRDDYRGIAVSSALSKLYSMVLLARLDTWAESQGLRAMGQAGFRVGRSTSDNAFVLQHVIEKQAAAKRPLFAAFIDFRKAYDCVDRQLLWRALAKMGVHGDMLSTLQGMYAHVTMRVKSGGRLGEPFPAQSGVRQGDPLSPLLFGLYIDQFEEILAAQCPGTGVCVAGDRMLQLMLYADDLVLLAEDATTLQQMLHCLDSFCASHLLAVNVAKSVVVTWGVAGQAPILVCGGGQLAVQSSFLYLGIKFGSGRKNHARSNMNIRLGKATGTTCALHARCAEMQVCNPMVRCNLFNALVAPVLAYGCEVWGVYHMYALMTAGNKWGDSGPAEELHRSYLTRVFGVRKTTPSVCLLDSTGRQPIAHQWLARVCGWWNGIVGRGVSDLVRAALQDNLTQGLGWTTAWMGAVGNITGLAGTMQDLRSIQPLSQSTAIKWEDAKWEAARSIMSTISDNVVCPVRSVPDTLTDGFKVHVYNCWFRLGDFTPGQGFVYHVHRQQRISAIARLCFISHDLAIDMGRRSGVPRSARTCAQCGIGCEDEQHVLLECRAMYEVKCRFQVPQDIHTARDLMHWVQQENRWNWFGDYIISLMAKRSS
jgi:sorting nexin-29